MKSNLIKIFILLIIGLCVLFTFNNCTENNDPENEDPVTNESAGIFKCKVNGVPFSSSFITTSSRSGIISAKGIKASNGSSFTTGDIRISFVFGTDQSSVLGTGTHTVVGNLETANKPNNKNIVEINELLINGLSAYVRNGSGNVIVEKYYESTYWQGAKGTFNNIKIDTYTAAPEYKQDSVILTEGEFDFKYEY